MRLTGSPQWQTVHVGMLLLLLKTGGASAAEDPLITLEASIDTKYDDNLFRLPEKVAVVGGRNDTIYTPKLKMDYQQSYSRQHLMVSTSFFSPIYQQHSGINYDGYLFTTGWRGQIGRNWQPRLSYHKTHELSSFEDVQAGIVDMLDRDRVEAGLALGGNGRMLLASDVWREQQRHSSVTYENLDLDEVGFGMQWNWETRRGSKIIARYEYLSIGYRESLAQVLDYRVNKYLLNLIWPISNKLILSGHGGVVFLSRDEDSNMQRTWLGGSEVRWLPMDRWEFNLSYKRDTKDPGYNAPIAYSDTLAFEANWMVEQRLSVETLVSLSKDRYQADQVGFARADDGWAMRMALVWQPSEMVNVQPYWTVGERDSNQPDVEYAYRQVGVSFTYRY